MMQPKDFLSRLCREDQGVLPRTPEARIIELMHSNNAYRDRAMKAEASLRVVEEREARMKAAYLAAYTQFCCSLGAALHIKEVECPKPRIP